MKKIMTATIFLAAGLALPAMAHDRGDLILRFGATTVAPDVGSDSIVITNDLVLPGGVDVDDNTQLGLTGVWMFADKFGLELLAATPFKHDIALVDAPVEVGSTKHLPPTLSVQWYPRGGSGGWQPYLGLGLNYTTFFSTETTDEFGAALGGLVGAGGPVPTDLELKDSFGLAAQAGIDFMLGEHWMINAAIWYIDIGTEATVKTPLPDVKFDVDLDPLVYNIGVGYRF